MARSVDSLSRLERVAYYRGMAVHALQLAEAALTDEQKARLVDVAAQWLSLAIDVEQTCSRLIDLPSFPANLPATRQQNAA